MVGVINIAKVQWLYTADSQITSTNISFVCTIKTTIISVSIQTYGYNENGKDYIQIECSDHKSLRTMCLTSIALVRTSKLQDLMMKKHHLLNAIRKKFNANFRGCSVTRNLQSWCIYKRHQPF